MGRTIFTYGTLGGLLVVGSMLLSGFAASGSGFMVPEWLGYLIMLVALAFIFVGVKRYRDIEQGGVIKFGKAFLLGLGIAAVAAIFYVVGWEIYLMQTDYSFMTEYAEGSIAAREAAGASAEELAAYRAEMEASMEQYRNPAYRYFITFLEIMPVGLVVSLVSAALLRNSKFLPARSAG